MIDPKRIMAYIKEQKKKGVKKVKKKKAPKRGTTTFLLYLDNDIAKALYSQNLNKTRLINNALRKYFNLDKKPKE